MCLHSYEYFHSKIAAQSCLDRADRLIHGDTIADDPRLRVDGPLLAAAACQPNSETFLGTLDTQGTTLVCEAVRHPGQ
jgi:hypothetical protein